MGYTLKFCRFGMKVYIVMGEIWADRISESDTKILKVFITRKGADAWVKKYFSPHSPGIGIGAFKGQWYTNVYVKKFEVYDDYDKWEEKI